MIVLVVGLGSIGKKHIRALEDLGVEATVYALRSSEESEPYQHVQSISSLEQLPGTIDFAIVSNPAPLHLQTIEELLPLGCPLFIEKPLALTLDRVEEVIRAIEDANITTYMGCQMRRHPCLQYVKDMITDKEIRSVEVYDGSYMPDWVPGKDFTETIRVNEAISGGVHLELIHEMDYVYWLFGKPRTTVKDLKRTGTLGVDVIDDAHYDLSYEDFAVTIDVNYIDKTPRRTLQVETADGLILADFLAGTVLQNGKEVFSTDWTMREVFAAQMSHFLAAIEGKIPSLNPVQEGAEVLQMALQ